MTVEEAVRARVMPPVAGWVGDRVYTLTFPQKPTWPAIRLAEVSEVEDYHLRGAVGIRRARVQVDVVAPTFSVAAAILAAAHGTYDAGEPTGLSGFAGIIDGDPPFVITAILADGARSMWDPDELAVVRLSRDYTVFWRAA